MNHLQKILSEKNYVLERVFGEDISGKSQFAYVLVKQNKIDDLRKALKSHDVDLSQYGFVVASGSANAVPDNLDKLILEMIQDK
jgi:hypothetical protein